MTAPAIARCEQQETALDQQLLNMAAHAYELENGHARICIRSGPELSEGSSRGSHDRHTVADSMNRRQVRAGLKARESSLSLARDFVFPVRTL